MKSVSSPMTDGPRPRFGFSLVIDVCCENGILQAVEGGCMIFHCPDHMTLCIKDGEVLSYESHGVRQ